MFSFIFYINSTAGQLITYKLGKIKSVYLAFLHAYFSGCFRPGNSRKIGVLARQDED